MRLFDIVGALCQREMDISVFNFQTSATSAEEPAAATSAEEPAAATSAEEPTAATSAEEPTAATPAEGPAADMRSWDCGLCGQNSAHFGFFLEG